jgi:hypothetical protein
MEVPQVLIDLTRASLGLDSNRLRLAVTEAEYNEIRAYCLIVDGRFHGRFNDYTLIIENMAPENWVEYR